MRLGITLVGIRTIKNFSLWSAVFSLMPNPKCGPFDLMSLWQDSLRRAIFARCFGKSQGLADAEDLFTAALLQDMAVPLLAKELPDDYVDLLEGRRGGTFRLSELEQARFGWTHSEAAGILARAWKLPESFATLIDTHTNLEPLASRERQDPRDVSVCLSSLLPSTCDEQWTERDKFTNAYQSLAFPGSDPLAAVFEKVDAAFEEFAPIMKLAVPAQPLSERLEESTIQS